MAQGNKKMMLAVCVAALTACGGGGGSDGPSSTAEGFWVGPTSSGYTARLVVLENGETWGLYSTPTAIVGALYGSTNSSNNGTLTGSGSDFYFPGRLLQTANYSGTFRIEVWTKFHDKDC